MAVKHPTPAPKIPKRPSTIKPPSDREDEIDRQMADTFPASDPPSFSGGNHMVGAPEKRDSTTASDSDEDAPKD